MGQLPRVEEHQSQPAVLEQLGNAPPPVPVEEEKRLQVPRNAISVAAVNGQKGLPRAAVLGGQLQGARHLEEVENQPPLNLHPALR
jgi:hypothetical protein